MFDSVPPINMSHTHTLEQSSMVQIHYITRKTCNPLRVELIPQRVTFNRFVTDVSIHHVIRVNILHSSNNNTIFESVPPINVLYTHTLEQASMVHPLTLHVKFVTLYAYN